MNKGSALLLLLAIADHAHDDGTGAWPSIKTLARKTRMSRRNVQLLVRHVEATGELKVLTGKGPHGCNAYAIQLPAAGGEKIAQVKNPARGMKSSAGGVKSGAFPSGEAGFTRTRNHNKPPGENQGAPPSGRPLNGKRATHFQGDFLEEFLEKRRKT